jgi:hypothetical protein
MVPFCSTLIDYRLGAYIEGGIRKKNTAIKSKKLRTLLVLFLANKKSTSQKALHNPWSLFLSSWRVSLAEYN